MENAMDDFVQRMTKLEKTLEILKRIADLEEGNRKKKKAWKELRLQEQQKQQGCLLFYVLEDMFPPSTGCRTEYSRMDSRLWRQLPSELLEMVLLCLPRSSQARFQAVCKSWKTMLTDVNFNKKSCLTAFSSGGHVTTCRLSWSARAEYESRILKKQVKFYELDLAFLPPPFSAYSRTKFDRHHWIVCGSGLVGIIVVPRDGPALNICILNPVNRTWRVLPHLSAPLNLVGYLNWQVSLVRETFTAASEFRVIVLGKDRQSQFAAFLCVYSSDADAWSTVTAPHGEDWVADAITYNNMIYETCTLLSPDASKSGLVQFCPIGDEAKKLVEFNQLPDLFVKSGPVHAMDGAFQSSLKLASNKQHVFGVSERCEIWRLDESSKSWVLISRIMPELEEEMKILKLLKYTSDKDGSIVRSVSLVGNVIFINIYHGAMVDQTVAYHVIQGSWQRVLVE